MINKFTPVIVGRIFEVIAIFVLSIILIMSIVAIYKDLEWGPEDIEVTSNPTLPVVPIDYPLYEVKG